MLLLLSPHLDDAVFSVSHLLGPDVLVVTIFTKEMPHQYKGDYAAYADMQTRKLEDAEAMRDIAHEYLNIPDVLFRGKAESNVLPEICKKLNAIRRKYDINHVYCPFGIGEHPDHLLTYDACLAVFPVAMTTFYGEYPYFNLPLNRIVRFRRLGLNPGVRITWRDMWSYFTHPIYSSTPWFVRIFRILRAVFSWTSSTNRTGWGIKHCPARTDKLQRCLAYGSQIRPIFGSADNLAKELDLFPNEYIITLYRF